MKVLHVVESFNGQAIERWLLQLTDEINRQDEPNEWDFFCTLEASGKYSDMVASKGLKVICSDVPISSPLSFLKGLRRVVKEGGYDVVHCHHDIMSAFYLLALVGLPVGKRIVHIHNTSLGLPTQNRLKGVVFRWLFMHICTYLADHIVGVSEEALKAFHQGKKNAKMSVIHCGIDLLPYYDSKADRSKFRERLKIPNDSIMILFVGRMIEYKNPCFVLDVLEEMPPSHQHVYAIFAGVGPLEEKVRKMAGEKLLSKRVRVLGWQDDIPSIMHSCELLIWPGVEEPMEGLGLGVIEAQTAGLKVVMSRNVPKEAIVIPELVYVVPLADGPKAWADTIVVTLGHNCLDKQEALQRVEASSFSISESASNIRLLYDS